MLFKHKNLIGAQANKLSYSASVNFKHQVSPQLMTGIEVMHGYRALVGGDAGTYSRIQFSSKYTFGYINKSIIEK